MAASVSGKDSLGVRRQLQVGDAAYDYFSLEAAAAGSATSPACPSRSRSAREPPAPRGRPDRHARGHRGAGRLARASGAPTERDRLPPGARAAAGLHRRAGGGRPRGDARGDARASAATRRRSTRSSPVDLVIDHSVQVDAFGSARRVRAQRRARVRAQPRALRSSCAGASGASTTSASCRPAPASATRSTSSTWRRWSATTPRATASVAYPDTLVGTDSHTTMINGLGVLGWGVGGIEAEAAMLGQPISMLIPEVVGFKLTGRLPEGATATDLVLTVTADAAQEGRGRQVRRVLRRRASTTCRSPTARRSPTWRPSTARPAASSRSTTRRSLPALHRPRPEARRRWSRPTARSRACCARARRPSPVHRHARARPRRPSSRRSPARSGRRTASRCRESPRRPSRRPLPGLLGRRRRPGRSKRRRLASDGAEFDLGHGAVVIARDHELHQHLEPVGDARRRPARAEGGATRPDAQAVGQDHPRARLAGGDRLPREGRADGGPRARSASTWSATAAPPASATPGPLPEPIAQAIEEQRPGRGRGALRQPQLRGPHQPAGAGQLPGVAAAGRRLRARRHLDVDLANEPLGTGSDGKPVYPARHLADPSEVQASDPSGVNARACSSSATPTSSRATSTGARSTCRAARSSTGTTAVDLRPASRRSSTDMHARARAARATSRARALLALLGDSSRPTTSRRPARSSEGSPAGEVPDRARRRARRTSTRYGARRGNHEVMMRGTFANIRLRNQLAPGIEGGCHPAPAGRRSRCRSTTRR